MSYWISEKLIETQWVIMVKVIYNKKKVASTHEKYKTVDHFSALLKRNIVNPRFALACNFRKKLVERDP